MEVTIKMKKAYIIIILAVFVVSIICWSVSKSSLFDSNAMGNGNLLMADYNKDGVKGIKIYNLDKQTEIDFIADGSKGVFLNNNLILFKRGDSILYYDIKNGEEKIVYTNDEYIDNFSLYSQNKIVIYQDENTVIQDIQTNETEQLVLENLIGEISVTKDATTIYYSDGENIIKYNIETDNSSIVENGINPKIYNDTKIAFSNADGVLVVKDLISNDVWKYKGQPYNYCFSPCGKYVAVETEMSLQTGILNLFKNQRVLGHKVVLWEYETGKTRTIVKSCESGVGKSFSWNCECDSMTEV